jgi:malate/lactate dehydrogenase
MAFVAVIGSGPLGGAVAQTIARRDRVAEVRLIDPEGTSAQGKALDILQSAPIDQFSTRVTASESIDAAAGANVIVLADAMSGSDHTGDQGFGIVRRLSRIGAAAPIVCAGARQVEVIARAVAELRMPRNRILGSAPGALESALRALAGIALDGSGVEIALRVLGVPPHAAVVAWDSANVSGQPLSSALPPHTLAGLAARIPGLWPPGPYALASAAARVVEAILHTSRKRPSCFVALDAGPARVAVSSTPVLLGPDGIRHVVAPALTRQEQTLVENAMEGRKG